LTQISGYKRLTLLIGITIGRRVETTRQKKDIKAD